MFIHIADVFFYLICPPFPGFRYKKQIADMKRECASIFKLLCLKETNGNYITEEDVKFGFEMVEKEYPNHLDSEMFIMQEVGGFFCFFFIVK